MVKKLEAGKHSNKAQGTIGRNGHQAGLPEAKVSVDGDGGGELLQKVSVGAQSIDAYTSIVGEEVVEALKSLAQGLRGARVLHVNSTAYGGGVAELLRSQIPLLRDLGIDAEWVVIRGDDPFFNVTKAFHNALQGGGYQLSTKAKETYLANNSRNARCISDNYDYVIIHDPQPLAIRAIHGGNGKWVWRCHIDTSNPDPKLWNFLKPYIETYDAMVFTMEEYVQPELPRDKVTITPPAIDPLSPKNLDLPGELCRKILGWVGIDENRPLLTQVSRFDPWKDPLGVVECYRQVKKQVPGVQLALLGHLAMDDPEGFRIYEQVLATIGDDPDVHTFTNFTAASSIEVNAFQRTSDVIIQKSIREGFGLVVAEALWKDSPVVAGRVGGIPLQLEDRRDGFLVDSVEQCTEKVLYLLEHPDEAREMGRQGRAHVRSNFLTPRLVSDELTLLRSV